VVALIAGLVARSIADFKIPILWLVIGAIAAPIVLDQSFEKDLFSWLSGARGEEQVGAALKLLAGEGFSALHDVDAVGIGNIDHVVFGPTGAYAIETKAWSGTVYPGKGGRLMCNGQDRHKHVKQATREAVEVGKRLKRAGVDVWVQPVIVLTRAKMKKQNLVFDRVPIIPLKQMPDFLRTGRGGPFLDTHMVERCAAAVLSDPQMHAERTTEAES
jgi:hypothetical protein